MTCYPQYPKRLTLSLDGAWNFAWLGEASLDSVLPSALSFDDIAAVPGVWDTTEKYHGQRGVGVYQCVVHAPFTGIRRMRLRIGALGLRGRVWWDQEPLGDMPIPYSNGEFDLDVVGGRGHHLTIAVDNRFDAQRSPLFPPFSDFYAYGGIYRSVSLMELPATRLHRVVVRTLDAQQGKVQLTIRLQGEVPRQLSLRLGFDEGSMEEMEVRPEGGQIVLERLVPAAKVWTLQNPSLHTISVQVGDDVISERFGLRSIEARGGAIYLNGQPLRIKGVNRHEAHPQFGPVQSVQSLLQHLQLIR